MEGKLKVGLGASFALIGRRDQSFDPLARVIGPEFRVSPTYWQDQACAVRPDA